MVVFCKRCGTPVKLDNARLADPAYSVKCQQCQRPVAIDTVRPGAAPHPGPGRRSPAGTPAAGTAGAAAARAAEEHAQALDRTHYLQKIRLFSGLPYEECLLIESRITSPGVCPAANHRERRRAGRCHVLHHFRRGGSPQEGPQYRNRLPAERAESRHLFRRNGAAHRETARGERGGGGADFLLGAGAIGFRRSAADQFQGGPRHEPRARRTPGRSRASRPESSTSTSPNCNSTLG